MAKKEEKEGKELKEPDLEGKVAKALIDKGLLTEGQYGKFKKTRGSGPQLGVDINTKHLGGKYEFAEGNKADAIIDTILAHGYAHDGHTEETIKKLKEDSKEEYENKIFELTGTNYRELKAQLVKLKGNSKALRERITYLAEQAAARQSQGHLIKAINSNTKDLRGEKLIKLYDAIQKAHEAAGLEYISVGRSADEAVHDAVALVMDVQTVTAQTPQTTHIAKKEPYSKKKEYEK